MDIPSTDAPYMMTMLQIIDEVTMEYLSVGEFPINTEGILSRLDDIFIIGDYKCGTINHIGLKSGYFIFVSTPTQP